MTLSAIPEQVLAMIASGALFAVNHSGGKDSQAMLLRLLAIVPREQLVLFHADLGEVEWAGAQDHIAATGFGLPVVVALPNTSFFAMVERRGKFPSPSIRQCTSDLKRGPITRELRRYLKANPRFSGQVVNCMGMRAAESPGRAKLVTFKRNDGNSKAGREWFDWLPIHDWSTADVFASIAEAGQQPHEIYGRGMSRFSCCFCIMASAADLTTAARLNPSLYARYVETEQRLGFTLSPSCRSLPEITGIAA